MPHFNKLLGLLYCPKSFHQGCRYVKGVPFVKGYETGKTGKKPWTSGRSLRVQIFAKC